MNGFYTKIGQSELVQGVPRGAVLHGEQAAAPLPGPHQGALEEHIVGQSFPCGRIQGVQGRGAGSLAGVGQQAQAVLFFKQAHFPAGRDGSHLPGGGLGFSQKGQQEYKGPQGAEGGKRAQPSQLAERAWVFPHVQASSPGAQAV